MADDISDPLHLHQSQPKIVYIAQHQIVIITSRFHAHYASYDALMTGLIIFLFGLQKNKNKLGERGVL